MKLFILIFCTFSGLACIKHDPLKCSGNGYVGYIFDSTYSVYHGPSSPSHFTPSCKDVQKAEETLRAKLKQINYQKSDQFGPIIHENLPKYRRQYVGNINKKGQKIIWINFLWTKENDESRLAKDVLYVDDGGSYYWNIKVNIVTEELTDLMINGVA